MRSLAIQRTKTSLRVTDFGYTMKVALLALIGAVWLATCASGYDRLHQRDGYYFEDRPRLGHFGKEPWLYLYEAYAAAFVKPLYPDMDSDNYLNFVPEGHRCENFLKWFVNNQYKVRGAEQVVLLDACLGYAFESTYQEQDGTVELMKKFTSDEKLGQLYNQTKVCDLPKEAQECVGGFLFASIRIKKQYPNVICNVHMLENFVNFADCAGALTPEVRENDSYVNFILNMVRERGHECFSIEIQAINGAVREEYNRNMQRTVNKIRGPFNSLRKQAHSRIWDSSIRTLLKAVHGTSKEINLRQVANIIRGIQTGGEIGERYEKRFLQNIANYATSVLNTKNLKDADLNNDPDGSARYLALIDNLCKKFRSHDTEHYYDYFTPFYIMIRMTRYEDIFAISEDDFIRHVLTHARETAPTYMSVSACNILTFTRGQFTRSNQNMPNGYEVFWVPNKAEMIKWPVARYY